MANSVFSFRSLAFSEWTTTYSPELTAENTHFPGRLMCVNTGKHNVFQSLHVHKNYPVESMHFPTFFRNGEFEKIFRRFTFHCCSVNLWKTTCIIPFTAVLRIPFQLCSQELTSRNHAFSGIFCNGEFVQGMHFPAFTTARLIAVRQISLPGLSSAAGSQSILSYFPLLDRISTPLIILIKFINAQWCLFSPKRSLITIMFLSLISLYTFFSL